ncbi:MAG: transporter substrate-binding domain-containing protein [Pseudomonadales bacterium]|nr:transporter substrate-binding domain-containing protein [Pseudomonadales bacterium]
MRIKLRKGNFGTFLTFLMTGLMFGLVCPDPAEARTAVDLELTPDEQRWLEANDTVTLAYDGFFPPYSFLNDDGELEGFAVDVMRMIGERAGIVFKVAPIHEWKDLYAAAQKQQVDVVATMVERAERGQWFRFSDPYIYKSLVVISRAEDDRIQVREDVAGKRVALVKNYQYVTKILSEFPSIESHPVDTMLDGLNAVSVGDADAAITFLGAGHYYRNKYLLSNLEYAAVYDKHTANESIAVRRDWPELAAILNKALHSIPEAELQKLRAKWLPADFMENLVELNLTETEKKWLRAHRNIRLGVDPEFAPFEYLDGERYSGMASDYVDLLSKRLNVKMEVVQGLSWKDVIQQAEGGAIDVLPAVGKTKERQGYLNFTQPYLSFHRVIITRDNVPFVAGLQDLYGQSVAVQADTSHHGYIKEHTDLEPVLYQTLQESLLAVSGGKADAFVGNVASATYWIRKLNLTNLKIAAPVSTEVQSLHFAVRKDWPELVPILEKGLQTISPRKRKEISEKWLSIEYEASINYTLLWQVVIAFSALVLIVVLWNVLLKRQVRLRTSQLAYTANYDQLTDLPNRFLILDRLMQQMNEARRMRTKVALISIDIDDFKKINDAFGHKTGDAILKEFSERVKARLFEDDNIGRLGGDQFLVIQSHVGDAADSVRLAEQLLGCLQQSFVTPSHEVTLTASMGISLYPDDGDTAESLLKNADTATHHAKAQMPGNFAFYTDNLVRNVSRKLELERHIAGALKRNEFEVYYQPKVDARSHKIVSFEALLRWFSPELGAVSPVEFIPIAEKSGLIEELGVFVLQEALSTLALWQEHYAATLSMAINLSPVQFRSSDLIPTIESFCLNFNLNSKTIEFEITEGVLLADYPDIEEKLKRLESLGVNMAMDDFGTGYSSMSYLRKYKFDTLKIDREFIIDLAREESDRKLVFATIAMAHQLGMRVVAEGVETEEQQAILVEQQCDYLQGWLFSKPLPTDQVMQLLDQQFAVKDASPTYFSTE